MSGQSGQGQGNNRGRDPGLGYLRYRGEGWVREVNSTRQAGGSLESSWKGWAVGGWGAALKGSKAGGGDQPSGGLQGPGTK